MKFLPRAGDRRTMNTTMEGGLSMCRSRKRAATTAVAALIFGGGAAAAPPPAPAPSPKAEHSATPKTGPRARPALTLALADALNRTVPRSWQIELDDTVAAGTEVRWRESADWKTTLQQLAASASLRAVVYPEQKVVLVQGDPRISRVSSLDSGAASPRLELATAMAAAPAARAGSAAAAAASAQSWELVANESVAGGLKRWAEQAGWNLQWDVQEDWSSPNATRFTGSFVAAARQLIEGMAANGADLHAKAYMGNKTLVVTGSGGGRDE